MIYYPNKKNEISPLPLKEDRTKQCCNCPPKLTIGKRKENTLASLFEVEHFLCNLSKAVRCFKLYEFFK